MLRYLIMMLIAVFLAPALAAQTRADKKIIAVADQIEDQVAEMRGHPFKRSIEKGIYTREQLKVFILKSFDEELPEEKLLGWGTALKIFGLVPENMDLKKTLVDFYVSQIGGFYDPDEKRLYCISTGLTVLQRIVMAHELGHALQDQYVDLEPYYKAVNFNDDLQAARLSVIEGEATRIMNLYPKHYAQEIAEDLGDISAKDIGFLALQQFAGLMGAPPYFYDVMTFPYIDGEGFVMQAMQYGGWKMLDMLYRKPPQSSEQIIHPKKFFEDRDEPQKVVLPDLTPELGDGFKKIYTNTMGEYQVKILLKHTADGIRSLRASAGWDGDTYAVYRSAGGESAFMVWAATFDTEEDAEQFREAEVKALTRKYERWGGGKKKEGERGSYFASNNNRCAWVEKRAADVLVLDAVPIDLKILEELIDKAWKFEKTTFDFEALQPLPYEG